MAKSKPEPDSCRNCHFGREMKNVDPEVRLACYALPRIEETPANRDCSLYRRKEKLSIAD